MHLLRDDGNGRICVVGFEKICFSPEAPGFKKMHVCMTVKHLSSIGMIGMDVFKKTGFCGAGHHCAGQFALHTNNRSSCKK
jgi:hypothetical protein